MRRKLQMTTLLLLILLLLVGCQKKRPEGSIDIYYLNALGDGITAEPYVLQTKTTKEQVQEIFERLAAEPSSVDYRSTMSSSVEVVDTHIDDSALSVYFNRDYQDLTGQHEVLVRAAIVKSLLQIDGIDSVSFFVSDNPLQDSAGNMVGSMTADTFVESYDNETESMDSSTMTLYFASADGQSLVKQNRDVYYSKNVAKERLVVEYLLKGPETNDALAIIPSGTKILNVTVTDGVCYVNFDSTFFEQSGNVSSDVVLYGIVDSLTELDNINKVQILVNGASVAPDDSSDFKLGKSYERDTTLVNQDTMKEVMVFENNQ